MMLKLSVVTLLIAVGSAQQANNGTRILIMGDSWGTVSPATEHFEKELNEHKCPLNGFTNIAIGGTTAEQWSKPVKMAEVKKQAANHDLIWITLMVKSFIAIAFPNSLDSAACVAIHSIRVMMQKRSCQSALRAAAQPPIAAIN